VAESVLEHYDKVRDYLRQGNWAEYGRELEELEKVLKEMSNITKKKK
jgi:acyl carrier protein phosphodiesterase